MFKISELKKRKPHSEEAKMKMRESALKRDNSNRGTHRVCAEHRRIYLLWNTMKSRCENPNREKYKDYGARGIRVCDEWQDAKVFCEWALNNGYKEGLQIDRIDNDGNYEPSNCRFVTLKENTRNRRNTVYLTVNEVAKSASEWSEVTGISSYTIYWWVKKKGKDYAEQRISEKL